MRTKNLKNIDLVEYFLDSQKFLRSVRNVRGGRRVSSGVRVTPRKRVRLVEWATTVGSYLHWKCDECVWYVTV